MCSKFRPPAIKMKKRRCIYNKYIFSKSFNKKKRHRIIKCITPLTLGASRVHDRPTFEASCRFTSATFGAQGSFDILKNRKGMDDVILNENINRVLHSSPLCTLGKDRQVHERRAAFQAVMHSLANGKLAGNPWVPSATS